MKIAMVGTGYVGLPQGAVFANVGNKVICVDCLEDRINEIKKFCDGQTNKLPVHESGLNELVLRNYSSKSLDFTTDINYAVKESDLIFLCVGTPANGDGSVNTQYVLNVAKEVGNAMNYADDIYKMIVIKSTVPPGTAKEVSKVLKNTTNNNFDIISNPEFLAQGEAVSGSHKPDRIVIGLPKEKYFGSLKADSKSVELRETFRRLYAPFNMKGEDKVFFMTNEDAELHKYIANTYLAAQIAVTNEAANLAKKVGANWRRLSAPIKYDPRIGSFIHPSTGFGGSCFPKDVKAIVKVFEKEGVESKVISKIIPANEYQKLILNQSLEEFYDSNLNGKTFSIWGLSFKAETNDTRESSAIEIITDLLKKGAKVKAYDPEGVPDMKIKLSEKEDLSDLLENVEFFSPYNNHSKYDALKDSDGLMILTEWMEFRQPDFIEIKKLLKNPLILDGRDLFKPEQMKELGFNYICIGNENILQ